MGGAGIQPCGPALPPVGARPIVRPGDGARLLFPADREGTPAGHTGGSLCYLPIRDGEIWGK